MNNRIDFKKYDSLLKSSHNFEIRPGKVIEQRPETKFVKELPPGQNPLEFLDENHLTDGNIVLDLRQYKRKP